MCGGERRCRLVPTLPWFLLQLGVLDRQLSLQRSFGLLGHFSGASGLGQIGVDGRYATAEELLLWPCRWAAQVPVVATHSQLAIVMGVKIRAGMRQG